mmetsp:Transcript_11787/g.30178  ORF Transcript_11787/g.30178 Transcript_11787/m.30178 type:complete len:212 (-) Transcript_11787:209-844(-)
MLTRSWNKFPRWSLNTSWKDILVPFSSSSTSSVSVFCCSGSAPATGDSPSSGCCFCPALSASGSVGVSTNSCEVTEVSVVLPLSVDSTHTTPSVFICRHSSVTVELRPESYCVSVVSVTLVDEWERWVKCIVLTIPPLPPAITGRIRSGLSMSISLKRIRHSATGAATMQRSSSGSARLPSDTTRRFAIPRYVVFFYASGARRARAGESAA